MRNRSVSVFGVLLLIATIGGSVPLAAQGQTRATQAEVPSARHLYLVPNDGDGARVTSADPQVFQGQRIHNYGSATVIAIDDPSRLSADAASRMIPLEDSSIVAYRNWQG